MALCKLNTLHPIFLKQSEPLRKKHRDFEKGLDQVRKKIETNHSSSNWFPQPLPGFSKYKYRLWKYDWAPPSLKGSNRKPWRLLTLVSDFSIDPVVALSDASLQPIVLTAFAAYSKADLDGLQGKELVTIMEKLLQSASTD